MIKVVKQIGWLVAVIVVVAILSMLFTGIIQVGMTFFAERNGVVLSEAVLYGISGTLGAGLGAVILWTIIRYVKKLRFYRCPNPEGLKWTAVFILLTIALCRVVVPGIWAYTSYMLGAKATPVGNAQGEPLWEMILVGVILSPLLEELLFRKDIFSLLTMRFSVAWSVGLSALFFAVVHGYSAAGFVSCLIAGCMFAILMARTGKLLPCIVAHALCNLEAVYYNLTETTNPIIVNLDGHTTYNVYVFAVGLAATAICGVYLYKFGKKEKQ